MIIDARTPCRIDLAGGSLDPFPLYRFDNGGLTMHLAIQPASHVRLETRPDRVIKIHSEASGAQE